MCKLPLEGVFPPIPTPFDVRGGIDLESLLENLRWLGRFGLSGVVVLGSNGEAVLLDEREKLRLIEAARLRVSSGWKVVVGTGLQSTAVTISLTQAAAAAGADYALVLPPSYYRGQMTDEAMIRHFCAVADASPIPIVLYNMPACTGLDLSAELIVRLGAHENVVGLKESGGDVVKIGRIRREGIARFSILAGSASFLLPALSMGACGGVLALANIAPLECIEIVRLASAGDVSAARDLQVRMIPLNLAVTRQWGVPGLKAAMDLVGLRGGPVRPPLLPLSGPQREALRSILIEAGVFDRDKEEITR